MLEGTRRHLRGLVRFLEKAKKVIVYTDFADEMGEATLVDLPGITPGTNWERFQAKAKAYLTQHQDHVALQRLRRNRPLTADDLEALEHMLDSGVGDQADIDLAREQSHGLSDCSYDPWSDWTAKPQPKPSAPTLTAAGSAQTRSASST